MARQDSRIIALGQEASALEIELAGHDKGAYQSRRSVALSDEKAAPTTQLFSSFGAGVSGIEVTCNGTDVCQSTSDAQTQVGNSLYEVFQLDDTVYQLQRMVSRQSDEIAQLQNNTNNNPNVTGLHYVKTIQIPGNATFTSNIIELQDGRIAAGQFGHSYWNDSVSIVIYDVESGNLSANLTAPGTVSWFCQQILQLEDGRLLSSVYNLHQAGESLLHVWNVTTGELLETVDTSDRAIHSMIQLRRGVITTLDFAGQLNAFYPDDLVNPFMQIPGVSAFVPDSYLSQIEIVQQRVSYLFAIHDAESLIVVNTDLWQIEGIVNVSSSSISPALKSIYLSGYNQISAHSDNDFNPIVINLENYIPSYVIDAPSFSMGVFSHGILAVAALSEPIISIWNPTNGNFLRFLTIGVPEYPAHLMSIDGVYNGLMVGSGYGGMISIYSY